MFLAEVGLFDFLSRPFLRPVAMYAAFAIGKLRRKRNVKTHRIRDTSSIIEDDEEEKLQSMDVPDVCIAADQDPLLEEQRVEDMRAS